MSEAFKLVLPVATNFFVNDPFNSPRPYANGKHEGIDLKAVDSGGRPVDVLAGQRGRVDKIGFAPDGYGNYVHIRHEWEDGSTYVTWYGHLSQVATQVGKFVQAGEKIGVAGTTGNSTGVHLHLTLQHIGHGLHGYVVDDVVDPAPYLSGGGPVPSSPSQLNFVSDVTIPDGTILQPGTSFTKTWRVRNTGSTTWGSGYQLAYKEGERMGGPAAVALPALAPGQEGNVSLALIAPNTQGRARGYWQGRTPAGNAFEVPLWVEIVVAGPTDQDAAEFVADVNYPPGSVLEPGQTFLKQWRVKNTGTTLWNPGYRLVFFSDNQLGGPDSVATPNVPAGAEAVLGVTLTAPQAPGSYTSTWRLRDDQGQDFGEPLSVQIQVRSQDPQPDLLNQLTFVADVTIPDGTPVQAGQVFTKTWRVRNTGQSTWSAGYVLAFFADEQLSGPASVALPALAPGQVADVSLQLTAPAAPGRYKSTWKGRTPQGVFFDYDLYADIVVSQGAGPGSKVDDSLFVTDVTIPDGSTVQAGANFQKTWRIRNTGTTTWGPGYTLNFIRDTPMASVNSISVPKVLPGGEVNLTVNLKAPLSPGNYQTTWRLKNPQGQLFGHDFYAKIKVPAPQPAPPDNRAMFLSHETIPLDTVLQPGQVFEKVWVVRNIGRTPWDAGYSLAYLDGAQLGGPESVAIPATPSMTNARLKVTLTAPTTPGTYRGYWKLRDPQGKTFGPRLPVWIKVK